jgi:hypothetical protein
VLKINVSKMKKPKNPIKCRGHWMRFLSTPNEVGPLGGTGSAFVCGESGALMENDFEVAVP